MFSIVIRNKNESKALQRILPILYNQYSDDFDEIILVDNYSTDNSVEIAKQYHCRIEYIKEFTYGKAINLGISCAKNQYILLLSAHSVPIGKCFFKTALKTFKNDKNIAGLRFINSIKNYEIALNNNFITKNPLENGLMAACAMVNKEIWQRYTFDEKLMFSEDKEWSKRVIENNYKIIQLAETFFYFAERNNKNQLSRFINENTAQIILNKTEPTSISKIIFVFIYNILFKNLKNYFLSILYEFKLFKTKLIIRRNVLNYYINKPNDKQ
ncbi:MAG: glycosyltransferase [Flavobacteriaceae bacterium]|nr:glycosyltransferase [Flavobacteriaceae bacterium]